MIYRKKYLKDDIEKYNLYDQDFEDFREENS